MFEYRLAAFLLRIKAIDDLPVIISLVSTYNFNFFNFACRDTTEK